MGITLALVNDHELIVAGVSDLLASFGELEIVDLKAGSLPEDPVDIVLYDTFSQAHGDGPTVAALAGMAHVGATVVYTWSDDATLVRGALAQGARGYLSKTLSADDLVQALVRVHGGEVVVSDSFTDGEGPQRTWPGRAEGLTERESEVVSLITQGFSNQEIVHRLFITMNTLKKYIRAAYAKMGVESRTQAVLWGIEHQLTPRRPS